MPGKTPRWKTSLLTHKKHQGDERSITHSLCLRANFEEQARMITSKLPKKFAETKTFAARKMMRKKNLEDERLVHLRIGAWKRKIIL